MIPTGHPSQKLEELAKVLDPVQGLRRLRRWLGLAIGAGAAFIIAIGWLQWQQRQGMQRALENLAALRVAEVDLARGLVRLQPSAQATATAASAQAEGAALLDQAMRAFDRLSHGGQPGGRADSGVAMQQASAVLRQRLGDWLADQAADPSSRQPKALALQLAYADVERHARRLDDLLQQDVYALARANQRTFSAALAAALLALGLLAFTAVRTGRRELATLAEQHRLSQALANSEASARAIFQHAPVAMGLWTPDGSIRAVNQRFTRLFGYTLQDLPDVATWQRLAYPDPQLRAQMGERSNAAALRATATRDLVDLGEGPVRCKDGSERIIHIQGVAMADGLLSSFFDMTALRGAERAANAALETKVAERTAELSAANRELESFAYAVSHDLRAPLRAMSGFSRALQEDHGAQLPAEARNYLDQIALAARRMGELIDGILALSRLTRAAMRRDRVDVTALARRRLAELSAQQPDRRVAVEVSDGLQLVGDERLLSAALTNVLDNAWKYTGHSAEPRIRVYAGTLAGKFGICISDNGAGFDMAHAARLFQPFQRIHRQDEFPGLGIGLATVQRIVNRHGGDIVAYAERGLGATFCIVLPMGHGDKTDDGNDRDV